MKCFNNVCFLRNFLTVFYGFTVFYDFFTINFF